jgi:hypothetical protein
MSMLSVSLVLMESTRLSTRSGCPPRLAIERAFTPLARAKSNGYASPDLMDALHSGHLLGVSLSSAAKAPER